MIYDSHIDLVQTIVTNLQKNNIFTPITLLLEERIRNPLRTHHRYKYYIYYLNYYAYN